MKRIRLICMMAVVAIVTAVCCSFTSREDRLQDLTNWWNKKILELE